MKPNTQFLSAWSVSSYGGPEKLTPVTRPLPTPGPNDVLIRVAASGVSRADGMMRAGTPRFARLFIGLKRPRHDLIGTGFSGDVIATGSDVTRFAVGDAVYGMAGLTFGANASHIRLSEHAVLMHKPDALSHEEAAVMSDGPTTSLNFLQNLAELRPGEKVLILGAAGSLGTAAVQIAKAMGADVTGTCSARNVGLVASLGASQVIDYRTEDFTKLGRRYDVIYDTLGISSYRKAKKALTRSGRYVCPVLSGGLLIDALRTAMFGRQKARFAATGMLKPEEQRILHGQLIEMVENDQLAPVMDRTYPFDQLVEAHRYMETGHKRGNVAIA